MKRKRNPYLFDIGYHITSRKNIDLILERGLIVNKKYQSSDLAYSLLYENTKPLWFLTTLDLKKLSDSLKGYLYDTYINHHNKACILKVDVSKFDQKIDIYALTEMGNNRLRIVADIIQSFADPDLIRVPKFIIPYLKKYNNQIPIEEFKNNINLIKQIIEYTKSFCITEQISSKYIIDIKEL